MDDLFDPEANEKFFSKFKNNKTGTFDFGEAKRAKEAGEKTLASINDNREREQYGEFYEDVKRGFVGDYGPNENRIIQYLDKTYHISTRDSFNYFFNGTHYEHLENLHLQNLINTLTKGKLKANGLSSIANKTRAVCFKPTEFFNHPDGFINLNNGILHIDSKELLPHDADYFFKYVLAHNYDANARCPKFMSFLQFVFQGDEGLVNLTKQAFGYAIMGGDPILHKAFMLHGEGRNGKSTWLRVLQALLGKNNWSAVSMNLLDKPFSMVQLDGKIANIVEESPYKINPEAFKNVVSGGFVTAAHKGKPEYDLKVNARFFFACNELPSFDEKSVAVKERLIIIPFNRYIEPGERSDDVLTDILREEMPGVLNFALSGISLLKANNFKISLPKSVEDKAEEFNVESDSVYEWCVDNITPAASPAASVKLLVMYRCYTQDMDTEDRQSVHFKTFKKRIQSYLKAKKIDHKLGKMSDREGLMMHGIHCTNPRFGQVALNLSML